MKEVSLSQSEREELDIIQFSDLSDDEKEIIRTAMENEEWRGCTEEGSPDGLGSHRKRVMEHRTDDDYHVYLQYEDTYYAVALSIEDGVYSTLPD